MSNTYYSKKKYMYITTKTLKSNNQYQFLFVYTYIYITIHNIQHIAQLHINNNTQITYIIIEIVYKRLITHTAIYIYIHTYIYTNSKL